MTTTWWKPSIHASILGVQFCVTTWGKGNCLVKDI